MNRSAIFLIAISAGALASCTSRDAPVDNNAADDNSTVVVVPDENATGNVNCPEDTRCIPDNQA